MRFPLIPIGDLIFVKRIEEHDGVLQLIEDRKSCRGKVIAVGPGAPLPDGSALPMDVRVNDVVFFGAATGIETSLAGEQLLIMRNQDILAVAETR